MDLVAKINGALGKLVGPNAVHAIDAMVAYCLTGLVAYSSDPSVRAYAASHPGLAVGLGLGVPALTALVSRFRKAAVAPKPAPAPAAAADAAPPAA